jgi:Flp pilus assembly protein TadD
MTGAHIRIALLAVASFALGGGCTQQGHLAVGNSSISTGASYQLSVKAFAADRAGNSQEALPLFRQLAEGNAAGSSSLSDRAGAGEKMGEYDEKGLAGLSQDYSAAASWYEKGDRPE